MEQIWKNNIIVKKLNGTFDITHENATGIYPYNVCPKEIDPVNLYDVAEVAAFWESLSDDDPRKQAEAEPTVEPVEESDEEAAETFCLNTSGIYHWTWCAYATDAGKIMTLEEIAAMRPGAKPCGSCEPPALPVPEEEVADAGE